MIPFTLFLTYSYPPYLVGEFTTANVGGKVDIF